MDELISIALEENEFWGCISNNTEYRFFRTKSEQIIWEQTYQRAAYKSYEHFVGVLSKFDPYTFFLKEPIKVKQINRKALELIWQLSIAKDIKQWR
jgi:hypothetical protein